MTKTENINKKELAKAKDRIRKFNNKYYTDIVFDPSHISIKDKDYKNKLNRYTKELEERALSSTARISKKMFDKLSIAEQVNIVNENLKAVGFNKHYYAPTDAAGIRYMKEVVQNYRTPEMIVKRYATGMEKFGRRIDNILATYADMVEAVEDEQELQDLQRRFNKLKGRKGGDNLLRVYNNLYRYLLDKGYTTRQLEAWVFYPEKGRAVKSDKTNFVNILKEYLDKEGIK